MFQLNQPTIKNRVQTWSRDLTAFLQAWTGPLFAWNGPAWFISALLFCYLVSPLLIGIVRNEGMAFKLLCAVIALRYGIEWVQISYPGKFWSLNYHGYPVVRCMEFYAGALMYPLYVKINKYIRDERTSKSLFTFFELMAVSVLLFVVIPNAFNQIRGSLVIWHCLFVFVFAFDRGFVSKIMGTMPFRLLATIELAFFLLHIPMKTFLLPLFSVLSAGVYCRFGIWLVGTLAVAFLWQMVVVHAYNVSRRVYWSAAMLLSISLLWVMVHCFASYSTRIELCFDKTSKSFLDKTERILIFYSTESKPEIWKQPILNLAIPVNGRYIFRRPSPKGIRQFRVEFQPKKGCKFGRCWPVIDHFKINGEDYSPSKLLPCYLEKGDRPSFDGKVVD